MKRKFESFAFIVVIAFSCCACPPTGLAQRRSLTLDNFDGLVQNGAGGARNTFERSPSKADAMMVPEARLGIKGLGLKLTVNRQPEGFCGYWIQFFDMMSNPRKYLDATEFQYLSFWVKGAVGGEKFQIKVADERWISKEDSVSVGSIDEYLPSGVTKRWQEVLVPLDGDLFSIDFTLFGGLTFDFHEVGTATVFIDDLTLKTSRAAAQSKAMKERQRVVKALDSADAEPLRGKAMWLWSLTPMLDDPTNAESLFTFCAEQNVRQIWAQIDYDMRPSSADRRTGENVSKCEIPRHDELREFLRAAHEHDLEIHALDGYPEHVQREYHHVALAVVDAIIDFNDGQPSEGNFDGIHFNNEPHLLIGWSDPQRRQQILFEFLTLNGECQRRVNAASSSLEFGVDIPFWLQNRDPRERDPIGIVAFNGRRRAASYHLLEMLDNVGVMNYRDLAQGTDGIVAHGRDLIEHADKSSRAKVFMGVETFAPEPIDVLFAVGRKRDDFCAAVRGEARHLSRMSRLDGHPAVPGDG